MDGPNRLVSPFKLNHYQSLRTRELLANPLSPLSLDHVSIRFGGEGPLPDTLPEFMEQVGKSFKRYYMGAMPRKFFYSLAFTAPHVEDEAYKLEQRLWNDVFRPMVNQPKVVRKKLEAWEAAGSLATKQPLTSFFLRHLRDILDSPPQVSREVSQASLAVMAAGSPKTQELSALFRSQNFKSAPVEQQIRLALPVLQPFIQPLLEKPKVLQKTITAYSDTLSRYPASPQRESGLFLLEHLKRSLEQPEQLKQETLWWKAQLEQGGWQKLSQLRALAEGVEKMTPFEQSALLLEGWEPMVQSALATPQETRTRLEALRQTMMTSMPASPMRETALQVSGRLIAGLTEPAVLQPEIQLFRTLVSQNGLQSLHATVSPFLNQSFSKATTAEKQQMLGSALTTTYTALKADPENSAKLFERAESLLMQRLPVGAQRKIALAGLDYLKNNLSRPDAVQPVLSLMQAVFSQNTMASLETMLKPFAEGAFTALPAAQKQQHLETVLTTAYNALAANPQKTAEWLNRLETSLNESFPPGSKRAILTFALTHLKNNLDKPAVIRQEIKLMAQLLGNGGLEKLQTLMPLMRSPEFAQADALQRGHWILEGLGSVFKPLLQQPDAAKAVLGSWLETLEKSYPQGLIRDTVKLLGTHLQNNLDKPERLTKAIELTLEILENGGFKKLDKLERIVQSDAYKIASPMKQGQYLLEGLGPIFVKAFQTLSTIPDLFKPHIQESMKQLYEDITPIPFEEVRSVIEAELGMPVDQAFEHFEREPVKAGSIAQVHRARVKGRPVAVKIVKPDVERFMEEDMNLLKPFVLLGQQIAPHLDANAFYEAFKALIKNEANMSQTSPDEPEGEAQRLMKIKEIYKPMTNVVVPEVITTHTTKHILTMEFMNGKSLLNYQYNPGVAQGYLSMLLDQIFYYGACQADPHPGNILYQEDKEKFACIDAGLMYFSAPEERLAFAKVLVALYTQNVSQIAQSVIVPNMTRHPRFPQFVAKLQSMPMLQQKNMDYKSTLLYLNTIAQVAKEFDLQVVTINPLLWKTLFTALTVAKTLDPEVNIAYPAIAKLSGLFISQRESSFMTTTAWSLLKDQGGKLWDYFSDRLTSSIKGGGSSD